MGGVILFAVLLVFWCVVFARLEAELEGENGWAAALPTARYKLEDGELWYRAFNSQQWVEVDKNSFRGKFFSAYIGFFGRKGFHLVSPCGGFDPALRGAFARLLVLLQNRARVGTGNPRHCHPDAHLEHRGHSLLLCESGIWIPEV